MCLVGTVVRVLSFVEPTGGLGLVPAHFALMIIAVVHVVGHRSILTGTCRGWESLGVMLGSSGIWPAGLWLFIPLWAWIGGCGF